MRNTAECKKFLVGILATNPSFLLERLNDLPADAIAKIVANAAKEGKWKRDWKCKPGDSPWGDPGHEYTINRPDGTWYQTEGSGFICERGFMLDVSILEKDDIDTQVGFIVMEDVAGTLHLSDYIGE